jgi:DNA-binding GntR family transcriptional regulator
MGRIKLEFDAENGSHARKGWFRVQMIVTASQETYDRLLEKLLSGSYPPGTRLVNRKLASELGVSVIPVREALGRLASEGLVEHIPGAGSFVRNLSRKEIVKLYSFREQLESFAVREASANRQSYQLERLNRILEESETFMADLTQDDSEHRDANLKRWLDLDANFHETVIDAADNPWLAQAVGSVRLLSHVTRTKPRQLVFEQCRRTLDEHIAIVSAIQIGDADAAEVLMRRHLAFPLTRPDD